MARIIAEFEVSIDQDDTGSTTHHEQRQGIQSTFVSQVQQLTDKMEELGSPFLEESNDLLRIDNQEKLKIIAHSLLDFT